MNNNNKTHAALLRQRFENHSEMVRQIVNSLSDEQLISMEAEQAKRRGQLIEDGGREDAIVRDARPVRVRINLRSNAPMPLKTAAFPMRLNLASARIAAQKRARQPRILGIRVRPGSLTDLLRGKRSPKS